MNTRYLMLPLLSLCLVLILTSFMCAPKKSKEQASESIAATDTIIKARVSSVTGLADLLRKGGSKWLQTKPGASLSSGDIIRTAQESRVIIDITGYGTVALSEQSLISISTQLLPDNTEFASCNLKQGSLLANTKKLVTNKQRFAVRTPTAVAAIRGTSFKTSVDQNTGESKVQVLRGQVAVKKRSFKIIKKRTIEADHSQTQNVLRPTEGLSAADVASVMNDLDQDWELELEIKAQKKIAAYKKKIEKKAASQNLSSEEIDAEIRKEQKRIEQKFQAMTGGSIKETVVFRGGGVSVINEGVTDPEEITSGDITSMTREFSKEEVEKALGPEAPSDEERGRSDATSNTPPQFVSNPPRTAQCNKALEYQILVEDDNPVGLFYNLQQSPKGMNIGSITGTVTWTPTDVGAYKVVVEVRDEGGLKNTQSFTINVKRPTEKPGEEKPDTVPPVPNDTIKPVVKKEATTIPDTVASSQTKKPDKKKKKEKPSPADKPPVIKIEKISKTPLNTFLTFKANVNDPDSTIVKSFWDFNNDSIFDMEGEMLFSVKHAYVKAGKYTVRFAVKTKNGKLYETQTTITINNAPPLAKAGSDVVSSPRRSVKLKGTGQDPDTNIVAYEWDFDSDGTYDWKSATSGTVSHKFRVYSYAVFRVTDSEGATGQDTVRIIICPKGMRTIKSGKFCIDTYEWPNQKNSIPVSNITYNGAVKKCASKGKRLCTRKEMATACSGGDKGYRYPYGRRFQPLNCNSLGNKRMDNKISRSGNFELCKSKHGVFDMSGNAAEWTSSGSQGEKDVFGGWWQADKDRATCGSYVPMDKSRKYFYVGFRCCK